MNKIAARSSKDKSYIYAKKKVWQWVLAYLSSRYVSYSMDGWWFEKTLWIHPSSIRAPNEHHIMIKGPSAWVFFSFFEMGMEWISVDDCRQQYFIWIGFVELISSAQYLDRIWGFFFFRFLMDTNIMIWCRIIAVHYWGCSKNRKKTR